MELDDPVCLCFRVSKRKLVNFVARERPRVPSQLSACGGAGTGCGWCVPLLRKLFDGQPDDTTAAEHAARRAAYLRDGRGQPPAGDGA